MSDSKAVRELREAILHSGYHENPDICSDIIRKCAAVCEEECAGPPHQVCYACHCKRLILSVLEDDDATKFNLNVDTSLLKSDSSS